MCEASCVGSGFSVIISLVSTRNVSLLVLAGHGSVLTQQAEHYELCRHAAVVFFTIPCLNPNDSLLSLTSVAPVLVFLKLELIQPHFDMKSSFFDSSVHGLFCVMFHCFTFHFCWLFLVLMC